MFDWPAWSGYSCGVQDVIDHALQLVALGLCEWLEEMGKHLATA